MRTSARRWLPSSRRVLHRVPTWSRWLRVPHPGPRRCGVKGTWCRLRRHPRRWEADVSATIQLGPYRGVSTALTTELNALAATTGKCISSAFDNSVNLDLFANLEMAVDFVSAPT